MNHVKDLINNINYNNVLVIIKRLIKYSKFIPAHESHSIEDLIDIIIRKVINNYKLVDKFVTDKDTIFALQFFITFIVKFEVNNKLSITFHL